MCEDLETDILKFIVSTRAKPGVSASLINVVFTKSHYNRHNMIVKVKKVGTFRGVFYYHSQTMWRQIVCFF